MLLLTTQAMPQMRARLATVPARSADVLARSSVASYQRLFTVNRPWTPELHEAAIGAALRCFEVV